MGIENEIDSWRRQDPTATDLIPFVADPDGHRKMAGTTFARLTALLATDAELAESVAAAALTIVAGAPGALDTLDELAAALGDDASYAATITTALAGKLGATAAVGGVLGGNMPNPTFAADMATQAELDAVAAAKQNGLSGTAAARPAAAAGNAGRFYWATDTLVLSFSDGTGWMTVREPRVAWVPTIANLTQGNGVWTSTGYSRSWGRLAFDGFFAFGTTSAITGALTLTLPVSSLINPYGAVSVNYYDDSAATFYEGISTGGATPLLHYVRSDGAAAIHGALANNAPFLWTTNDAISFAGNYPMNSPYT